MSKQQKQDQDQAGIQGNELTAEQLDDVYAAGTSDGIQQLAKGSVKIENEGYEEQH